MTNNKEVEGYLVSKRFDRLFMAFLLIGGILIFVGFPILALLS